MFETIKKLFKEEEGNEIVMEKKVQQMPLTHCPTTSKEAEDERNYIYWIKSIAIIFKSGLRVEYEPTTETPCLKLRYLATGGILITWHKHYEDDFFFKYVKINEDEIAGFETIPREETK